MVGSWHEAEDLVQETFLRALRANFEGRASLRVWLFRIATNVCLTWLAHRGRRVLPSGLGPPNDDFAALEVDWVEPIHMVQAREDLRLALIAALQLLPPRQRAVLILRDALGFSAREVAEMLETTETSVKSLLQRARAGVEDVPETLTVPESRELLEGYMRAFETADAALFRSVLSEDAAIENVGTRAWVSGAERCTAFVSRFFGGWRMEPTVANGQPAAVTWWHGKPYGLAVLATRADGITRIVVYADAELVTQFSNSVR